MECCQCCQCCQDQKQLLYIFYSVFMWFFVAFFAFPPRFFDVCCCCCEMSLTWQNSHLGSEKLAVGHVFQNHTFRRFFGQQKHMFGISMYSGSFHVFPLVSFFEGPWFVPHTPCVSYIEGLHWHPLRRASAMFQTPRCRPTSSPTRRTGWRGPWPHPLPAPKRDPRVTFASNA